MRRLLFFFLYSSHFLLRSVGAVASLYDLACLSQSPIFDDMQDIAYELWKASPENAHPPNLASFVGDHFFVKSPSGAGLSPVWDFRAGAAKGNADAFTLAAKITGVPAPTGPQDVDWLQLKSVSGSLATQVCASFCDASCPFLLMHLYTDLPNRY